MRLKSLEIHGFKSFVDKTAVRFQPGITAVVGPNGCGKSNVVDAIRWVMGEQSPRRLRGKGMEDVIFAGSEGRSPVGMAEVVLSFDNSDGTAPATYAAFHEIQIARRLYRTGESEYLLNKAPCRLRDVQDFFRDTGIGTKGYTIVEQGRIAEIVSAKAEERRSLIEEAAGIGKYKARRREAESKIASTEQNLLRVHDVLGEIKRQIGSIERQAKKAARFKRLRETSRVLELSLASDERRELVASLENAGSELQGARDRLTALETQVAERELGVQQKRIELAECEKVLTQGGEALLGLRSDIKECEGKIDYGRRERESLAELATARKGELAKLREQLVTQQSEVSQLGDELEAIEKAVASGEEQLGLAETAAADARVAREALETERDQSNTTLVDTLTAIARAEDRIATVADRRAELESRMRNADEGLEVGQTEASRVDQEQQALEEGLRNLLAERDRLMGSVKTALETHREAVEVERESGASLRKIREQIEGRRARLESLREVVEAREDVSEGTRQLLAAGDGERQRFGLRGLVRDAIDVDLEVEGAVEAVLAERAEAVVVNRAAGAVDAIAALRERRAGRGLFLAPPILDSESGGIVPLGQPLAERVRARPGFEDLVPLLFRGVNLVDDLAEVLRVYGTGRVPATFVTPTGDVLTPDGLVRGGGAVSTSGAPSAGALARVREVRDLEREVAEIESRVASTEQQHAAVTTRLAEASDELENLRNRHHTAALAVANHEKDLERTRERVKALSEAHEGRVSERSELLAEVESLGSEHLRLDQQLLVARQSRTTGQKALDALALRLGSASRDLQRLETVATEKRVEHAGRSEQRDRIRGGHERVVAGMAETQQWIERRDEEIQAAEQRREELAESIETARQTLEVRLREEEAARAGHDEKREAFERVSTAVNELEEGLRELRGDVNARREHVSQHELRVRETEMKRDHLDASIREKWSIELASWEPPSVDASEAPLAPEATPSVTPGEALDAAKSLADEAPPQPVVDSVLEEESAVDAAKEARANAALAHLSVEERRAKLEDIRKKLQSLGDVNLGAIEEHEELKERFRFLGEQKADLETTLTSLRDAISRINRTSRKRFRETFEMVSKRFSENFPRLFRGGKASLSLTETDDVLEAGIDIMAMPPGKRLQNVNLLSGGEKTLTAIALLVAVFQVRPSPFFLLDEVDAALDDANVGRFNELVVEMAGDSQFVMITHNKRTIEIADILYGVTMERKGVSKLVAVEMH